MNNKYIGQLDMSNMSNFEEDLGKKNENKSTQEDGGVTAQQAGVKTRRQSKVTEFYNTSSDSEDEVDDRRRTPSGNIVGDISSIKAFFSPKAGNKPSPLTNDQTHALSQANQKNSQKQAKKKRKRNQSVPTNHDQSVNRDQDNIVSARKGVSHDKHQNNDEWKMSDHDQSDVEHSESDFGNHTPDKCDDTFSSFELNSSPDSATIHKLAGMLQFQKDEPYKGSEVQGRKQCNTKSVPKSTSVEVSEEPSDREIEKMDSLESEVPETITLPMVYQMFKDLKDEMSRNKRKEEQEFEELKKDCAEGAVQAVEDTLGIGSQKMDKLKADLTYYKHKTTVLTEVCDRLTVEIGDLNQRLENVELSSNKRMVIISGFTSEDKLKKDQQIERIEKLILDELALEVSIDDLYYIGDKMVAEFCTLQDKKLVMKYKKFLKNVRHQGQKVYINDFIPMTVQEKRRRDRKIKEDLENDPEAKNVTVEYTRAGLTVAGVPYRKQITPPTPKELVDISVEDLHKILTIQSTKSAPLRKDNSVFQAYTTSVQTHQEVRDMYKRLKLVHPTARHISVAYWIRGIKHVSCDFHDDGEPGSGRILLDILERNNLTDRVIFVVRKYGGVKMGPVRFQLYAEVAEDALLRDIPEIQLVPKSQNKRQRQQQPQPTSDTPVKQLKEGSQYTRQMDSPAKPHNNQPYKQQTPSVDVQSPPLSKNLQNFARPPVSRQQQGRYDAFRGSYRGARQSTQASRQRGQFFRGRHASRYGTGRARSYQEYTHDGSFDYQSSWSNIE